MLRRSAAIAVLTLITLTALIAQTPARRAITEKDIFAFQWIGDPQPSPDGQRVAFVKVTVNEKRDGYDTAIYTVSTRGNAAPERLTGGRHDSAPRWSPDGTRLAFLRFEEKDGKPQPPQLYLLSIAGGGEAVQLTHMPKGAGAPNWSPDGKHIAFTSTTLPEEFARSERERKMKEAEIRAGPAAKPEDEKARTEKKEETETSGEGARASFNPGHESDVRVITRAVYRMNGAGYLDPSHPTHIWMLDTPAPGGPEPTPRQLTSGKFDESDITWSNDSALVYYTTTRIEEQYYELPQSDVYAVALAGGEPRKIAALDFDAGGLSLSPDGKRLALRGDARHVPVQSYTQPDLWVLDIASGGPPRNLTEKYDYDVGAGLTGDQSAPRAAGNSRPIWTADGRAIIDVVSKEGRANLVQFDASTGAPTEYTRGNHAVMSFRALSSASGPAGLLLSISTPTNIADLYSLSGPGGEMRRLTSINAGLFSQLNLTEPEEIWYPSFDGKRIQAWVQKPPDFDPAKKYPLILNIHGGPHAAYGFVFDHEFQWMAAKGYVVLYPNPRGSTSYGQEFGNIIQYHYPGDDSRDLLLGVDELIRRGYVDAKKLGVTGGSGGGVLTNWIVTHSDRFAAAVSQRDISDWASWWYTADFTLFHENWFKAPPFEDPADYAARSAITFVKNIRTPMMFILGEADYRTPPTSGGEQLFRALKYLKRPTIMIRFPGESHELSRSGQPWHRVERLQHIVGWMDKYLQGKRIPQYDSVAEQQPAGVPKPAEQPEKRK